MRSVTILLFALFIGLSLLPALAQSPNSIHGVWVGSYSCVGRATSNIEITIRQIGEKELRAIAAFKQTRGGDAFGVYTMSGRIDPASGQFDLKPEKWKIEPRNYQMIGISGHYYGAKDTVSAGFTKRVCFDLSVARVGAPELVKDAWVTLGLDSGQSEQAETFKPSRSNIPHGVWRGEYACQGGQKTRVELTIKEEIYRGPNKGEERFRGIFAFETYAGPIATGQLFIDIRYFTETGEMRVSADTWINRPAGYGFDGLKGRYDPDRDTMRLQFNSRSCFDLRVQRVDQPKMPPKAWQMLGVVDPKPDILKEVLLDGTVTTESIFIFLNGSEYTKGLFDDCYEGRMASNLDPLTEQTRKYCTRFYSGNTAESIRHIKPALIDVKPGSSKLDWENARFLSNGVALDGGAIRYDVGRVADDRCFVLMERDRRKNHGFSPIPVRNGQSDSRYMFKLMARPDPLKERELEGNARSAETRRAAAERDIPRLRGSLEKNPAWDGAACQRPTSDPVLPARPQTPDRTLVQANAAAFCYEVLQRRLNPGEAYGAMKALFLDDVLVAHKMWSSGGIPKLACAMRPPSQIGDILSRMFSGSIIGMEAIQVRFSSCVSEMVSNCDAPLTEYDAGVARIREQHLQPYNQCRRDVFALREAENNLPNYITRAADAQNALETYRSEFADRPPEINLSEAECRSPK